MKLEKEKSYHIYDEDGKYLYHVMINPNDDNILDLYPQKSGLKYAYLKSDV